MSMVATHQKRYVVIILNERDISDQWLNFSFGL